MHTMPCPMCLHNSYYTCYRTVYMVLLPAAVAANLAATLTSLMATALFANGYRASRDEKMGSPPPAS